MTKTFEELEETVSDLARDHDSATTSTRSALESLRHQLVEVVQDLAMLDQKLWPVEKLDVLAAQIAELEIKLLGDTKLREQWETARKNNVAPNIPEPAIGIITMLLNQHDAVTLMISDVSTKLAFTKRLEAFFAPMMENKNPPLDGAQVATKAYVDEAIARIAGKIREEIAQAREFVHYLLNDIKKWNTTGDADDDLIIATPLWGIAKRILYAYSWIVEREASEEATRNRPSRIALLRSAITGQPIGNGSRR